MTTPDINIAMEIMQESKKKQAQAGWKVCPLAEDCAVSREADAFENLCSSNYHVCQNYKKNHAVPEKELELKQRRYLIGIK